MAMDAFFACDEQKFVSSVVNPREFLEKAVRARNKVEKIVQLKKDETQSMVKSFSEIVGVSEEIGNHIFEHCEMEITNIKDPDNNFNFDIDAGLDDAVTPRTNSKISEHLQNERERRLNPQNKSIALRGMRYDNIDPRLITRKGFHRTANMEKWVGLLKGEVKVERPHYNEVEEQGNNVRNNSNPLIGNQKFLEECPEALRSQILPWGDDDILIKVSIYLGYSRSLEYHEIRLGRLMKVTDRLILRGNQTLFDLKKSFHCTQDYMCLEDVSHRNPTLDDLTLNRYPSSYFFIHDTFYMDDSKSSCTDTSECVRNWAKSRDNIGPMYLGTMNTKVIDLKFRLGQPYLYQHQGICEHVIVFTDFHLRDYNDDCGPYPIRHLERQFRRITCIGCRNEGADWAVMNCDVLPTTPAYLCRKCYEELLFHQDGSKRCRFEAVPYFDRKAMDDCGVFLEELKKNVSLVKKEEPANQHGYEIQPTCSEFRISYRNHLDEDDTDDSSFERSLLKSVTSTPDRS